MDSLVTSHTNVPTNNKFKRVDFSPIQSKMEAIFMSKLGQIGPYLENYYM